MREVVREQGFLFGLESGSRTLVQASLKPYAPMLVGHFHPLAHSDFANTESFGNFLMRPSIAFKLQSAEAPNLSPIRSSYKMRVPAALLQHDRSTY